MISTTMNVAVLLALFLATPVWGLPLGGVDFSDEITPPTIPLDDYVYSSQSLGLADGAFAHVEGMDISFNGHFMFFVVSDSSSVLILKKHDDGRFRYHQTIQNKTSAIDLQREHVTRLASMGRPKMIKSLPGTSGFYLSTEICSNQSSLIKIRLNKQGFWEADALNSFYSISCDKGIGQPEAIPLIKDFVLEKNTIFLAGKGRLSRLHYNRYWRHQFVSSPQLGGGPDEGGVALNSLQKLISTDNQVIAITSNADVIALGYDKRLRLESRSALREGHSILKGFQVKNTLLFESSRQLFLQDKASPGITVVAWDDLASVNSGRQQIMINADIEQVVKDAGCHSVYLSGGKGGYVYGLRISDTGVWNMQIISAINANSEGVNLTFITKDHVGQSLFVFDSGLAELHELSLETLSGAAGNTTEVLSSENGAGSLYLHRLLSSLWFIYGSLWVSGR